MLETWRQLSQLKTNLIQLADTLLLPTEIMSKESMALDLLSDIETINQIEQELKKKFIAPLTMQLSEETERDHLAGNEMASVNVIG